MRVRVRLLACLLVLAAQANAADSSAFRNVCPVAKGDSAETVKAFYGIKDDPQLEPDPISYHYSYRFQNYGVWIFFDERRIVKTLRFDAPFAGKIGGISIGASRDEVLSHRGRPAKEFQGIEDEEAASYWRARRSEIIDALPDPAPKSAVNKAFAAVISIDEALPKYTRAWVYDGVSPAYFRYDFSMRIGTVQTIISDRGTAP